MKYTKEILEPLAKDSLSIADVCRKLGISTAGGSNGNIAKLLKRYSIDTSHFLGRASKKGTISTVKKTWQEVLVNSGKPQHGWKLKRAMIEAGVEEKCNSCGQGPTWNYAKLVLQVDHIYGDNTNHELKNLRLLCPNCHSQTPTYSGRKNKFIKSVKLKALEQIIKDNTEEN